jgi:hypothetical protein
MIQNYFASSMLLQKNKLECLTRTCFLQASLIFVSWSREFLSGVLSDVPACLRKGLLTNLHKLAFLQTLQLIFHKSKCVFACFKLV